MRIGVLGSRQRSGDWAIYLSLWQWSRDWAIYLSLWQRPGDWAIVLVAKARDWAIYLYWWQRPGDRLFTCICGKGLGTGYLLVLVAKARGLGYLLVPGDRLFTCTCGKGLGDRLFTCGKGLGTGPCRQQVKVWSHCAHCLWQRSGD